MRKLIMQLATSLDGCIEGPNGEYDWCFDDGEDYGMTDFLEGIDSLLMGRKTYELMQSMGEEANKSFAHLKQYICSTTLSSVKPEAELVSGNVDVFTRTLKQQEGKDIWLFGGASLCSYLLDKNLIDEIMLAVHPVILGAGKPLFAHIEKKGVVKIDKLSSVPFRTDHVNLFSSSIVIP